MQIVIDISENHYKVLQMMSDVGLGYYHLAILNGTPLPKGHGRLLDEKDILDTENNDGGFYDLIDMPEYISGVKAIIEADKKSEE